jgi:hypothetical protein
MGTNIMVNQVKTPIQNYFEKVLYENLANKMTFITHGFRVSVVSDVRERVQDFRITFALYVKKIFIS